MSVQSCAYYFFYHKMANCVINYNSLKYNCFACVCFILSVIMKNTVTECSDPTILYFFLLYLYWNLAIFLVKWIDRIYNALALYSHWPCKYLVMCTWLCRVLTLTSSYFKVKIKNGWYLYAVQININGHLLYIL